MFERRRVGFNLYDLLLITLVISEDEVTILRQTWQSALLLSWYPQAATSQRRSVSITWHEQ
jgi:hypothetical protein